MSATIQIAQDAKLLRRRVWCLWCGHTQIVWNGLVNGWPRCCGYTMTLDDPATRRYA